MELLNGEVVRKADSRRCCGELLQDDAGNSVGMQTRTKFRRWEDCRTRDQ